MSGYYFMHRGWMDNPALDSGGEPYCRRAAWCWLIEHACWRDTPFNAAGHTITLHRGQLCHSIRHLADAWHWSVGAVQRFIKRLKTDSMIDTATDTVSGARRLIITVCNYERYQAPNGRAQNRTDSPTDTPTDSEPIQKESREDSSEANASESPAPDGADARESARRKMKAEFAEFYLAYPRKRERTEAERAYRTARRKGASHQQIMEGVRRLIAEGREPRFIPYPAQWLRKGGWQDEPESAARYETPRGSGRPMEPGAAAFLRRTDAYFGGAAS